jgi:hypothetical protein
MLLVLVILLVGATIALSSAISTVRAALDLRLDRQDELLEAFGEKLDRLQEAADELEYRSLTPEEKDHRRFKLAQRLTLSDVERLEVGQTLDLITCSYHYPRDEPEIDSFEYKHERLGEPVEGPHATFQGGRMVQTTRRYVPVHGFVRWDATQDWTSYKFLATAEECTTGDYAGTVRRP